MSMMNNHDRPVLYSESSIDADIDRLFNEALQSINGAAGSWMPECNVYENDQHFMVRIAVPGLDPNELHVEIENEILRVQGERKAESAKDGLWYAGEVREGRFACSFQLPNSVDQGGSTALYRQGMLTITFPKRETVKGRTIPIVSRVEDERREPMRIGHLWQSLREKVSSWFEQISWPRMRWS